MAILASDQITLTCTVSVEATWRYYKLQSSTQAKPSAPTTNPPTGWTDTEPTYVEGSTNTLYFVDLTEFSDGTWNYSNVSVSSSYEAAKTAYNKAVNALSTAKEANDKILAWCHDNNKTLIDGAKIYTGSITSLQIASNAITAEKIAAKAITTEKLDVDKLSAISSNLGSITAGSINIGNGKFVVTSDGVLTAKSGTFEGKVTSKSGSIAGITINTGDLSASTTSGGITSGYSINDDGTIGVYSTGGGRDYFLTLKEGTIEIYSQGSASGSEPLTHYINERGFSITDGSGEILGHIYASPKGAFTIEAAYSLDIQTTLTAGTASFRGDLEVTNNAWIDGTLRATRFKLGKYIDNATAPKGGIEVYDLRSVDSKPGMFGSSIMNVYFKQAVDDYYWKTILHLNGWSAGDYASHELAFNADNHLEDTRLYHRSGTTASGWTGWKAIIDSSNLHLLQGTTTGVVQISFPTGFNKDNCCILSVMCETIYGSWVETGYSSSYAIGVVMDENCIQITKSGASATGKYRIILARLS